MTLYEAYLKFIQDRKANLIQDSSITTYKANIKSFLAYIGSDTSLSELSLDKISSYMASLNGSVKRNTAISYIRDMKILLVFADGLERLTFNPRAIKKPKSEKRDMIIYSAEQWECIKADCKTYIDWITLRNIAILTCIYDSGIRKMEVCSIRLSSFQKVGDKLFCTVYGKGLKERQVFFGNETIKAFEAYKSACPFDIIDYFFLTKTGAPVSGNTVSQFTYDIERKLPFRFSCHLLRHTYATIFDYIRLI